MRDSIKYHESPYVKHEISEKFPEFLYNGEIPADEDAADYVKYSGIKGVFIG